MPMRASLALAAVLAPMLVKAGTAEVSFNFVPENSFARAAPGMNIEGQDWEQITYCTNFSVAYLAMQMKEKFPRASDAEIASMGSEAFVRKAAELIRASKDQPTDFQIENIELPIMGQDITDPGYFLLCSLMMQVAGQDGGFPEVALNKNPKQGESKYDESKLIEFAEKQLKKPNMEDVVSALTISAVWPAEASLNWCLRQQPKPSLKEFRERCLAEKLSLINVLAGSSSISTLSDTDKKPMQILATVLLGGKIDKNGRSFEFKGLPKGVALPVYRNFMNNVQHEGERILNTRIGLEKSGDRPGLFF